MLSFTVMALSALAMSGCEDGTAPPADPDMIGLFIMPGSATLSVGETQDFDVQGHFRDHSVREVPVAFAASGGTIDQDGIYTATEEGEFIIVAATGDFYATANVKVNPASVTLTQVMLAPASVQLSAGQQVQFSATGRFSNNTTSAIAVQYEATGGTITPNGLYTAGATAGTFRVIARASNGMADTSTVVISAEPAPTLVSLDVSPNSASLQPLQSQQFTVTGRLSDGSTVNNPTVTWTATGGAVSSSGRYTAGQNPGTYRVVASAGGVSDTAVVTIQAPPGPALVSLDVSPSSASLQAGQTQQFTVSGRMSDGSTVSNPSVTWTATGGSISSSGRYTAGQTAGTFRVVATSGSVSDTATITIQAAPPPTLVSLDISPSSTFLQPGQIQQFSVTGRMSDGSTVTSPGVTWTATGGSITSSGRYTAGQNAGSFRVVATSGNIADTASVTIQQPPEPGSNHMYFNSAEPGCGTNPDYLMCDDFEDGDWYIKNCDQANASGGLLQTDGWCGTIYANSQLAAGTARCGNVGFRSNCAATTGVMNGGEGNGNMADHAFVNMQGVEEVWVRFYIKPLSGYQFGAEKILTFNDGRPGDGGIKWGNVHINCGHGSASSTGTVVMQFTTPMSSCQGANVGSNLSMQSGNWYFFEVHYKLSGPGQANGVFELWMDNCGPNGTSCPATPTLRIRRTDVRNDRRSTSELIRVLWFESWANPGSRGERYWDQIVVSKTGPIGFMK